jgi:hypothetical protein
VHCRAGISRSSSLVLAFILSISHQIHNETYSPQHMMYDALKRVFDQPVTLQQAYDMVLHERPIINPNSSFRHQLREYESIIRNGHVSILNDDENVALIESKSYLWSSTLNTETAFDRIPIRVPTRATQV